jgi:hypothetical protein
MTSKQTNTYGMDTMGPFLILWQELLLCSIQLIIIACKSRRFVGMYIHFLIVINLLI